MKKERSSKRSLKQTIFGWVFAILGILGILTVPVLNAAPVWAEPTGAETTTETTTTTTEGEATTQKSVSCEKSLGALGWLVCPATGKISEAVDWLYDKIEDILVINPVEMRDGSPIYEIWKYFQGVTNIIFVIFLMVVIYSQLTGVGITNYGIKKILPKLIVVAILVNLSFFICSLLVDASNIIGHGLRGLFENIQTTALANSEVQKVSVSSMYTTMAGGTLLTIGAAIVAFETGAIWMLIPVALGAIVAVASGLITIALRQAVVVMLIMISPLAIVAYMLPNTEDLFKKWKKLMTKMLVFYPMFSLLFGASQLAGFALIASAGSDGFVVMLGVAVQIFPLFFSWSLMKMSGTFLESINTKLRALGARPVGGVKSWAEGRRDATRMRYLASQNAYTPSLRLRQFLSNRRIAREEDKAQNENVVKQRGLAYDAMSHRRKDGTVSREGEKDYARVAQVKEYERIILRDKNDVSKGLSAVKDGKLARDAAQLARLKALDTRAINASDRFKDETARTERIDYGNAVGYHRRAEEAINAHMDAERGYDKNGKRNLNYTLHKFESEKARKEAEARYAEMNEIMEGNEIDTQYAAATAAYNYDTQAKAVMNKFQKYFELTPPTQDLDNRMREFSQAYKRSVSQGKAPIKATDNIDAIISGLRMINFRGDTDIVKSIVDDIIEEGVDVGTHASQSLASFFMFDVKDNDPFLRRFGKYINLETANAYNKNTRKNKRITLDEYVKGYHEEPDGTIMYAKRPAAVLLEGTSFDNIERTAMSNMDESLQKVYTDKDGNLDVTAYLAKRKELETAIGPQFISASLKYLSGSEQIKSAVSFKTGYTHKQLKENGQVVTDENGDPVYIWEPMWADPKFKGHEDEMEKYFRAQTQQYLKDQTPTQVLGLRSDYRDPMVDHLLNAWLDEHPDRANEYNNKYAAIQNSFKDLPPAEAEKKRAEAFKNLRMEYAGEQMRELMDKQGKLGQIFTTRRSGAGNNAKDWVRQLLDLDNDVKIQAFLADQREAQRKQLEELRGKKMSQEQSSDSPMDDDTGELPAIYTDADRGNFIAEIEMLYRDQPNDDKDEFFEDSLERVKSWFKGDSVISMEYEHYYKVNPTADSRELYDYLRILLSNPDNYPDTRA